MAPREPIPGRGVVGARADDYEEGLQHAADARRLLKEGRREDVAYNGARRSLLERIRTWLGHSASRRP